MIVFSMARTALWRGQRYGCWRYHPGHEVVEEVTASTDSLECRQQHEGHCTANTKQFKHLTSLGGTESHPEVTGKNKSSCDTLTGSRHVYPLN